MADVLQTTIEVPHKGTTYVFRIPSYTDEIKIGILARNIRRSLDPETGGSAEGLDYSTLVYVRTAAVFQSLLEQCSDTWPFSEDAAKKPIVDYRKWSPEKVEEALAVGMLFETALQRFRGVGIADQNPAGGKTVES